jgi:hypothetical protein
MATKVKLVKIKADLPLIGFGLPYSEGQIAEVAEGLAKEIVDAKYAVYVDAKAATEKE